MNSCVTHLDLLHRRQFFQRTGFCVGSMALASLLRGSLFAAPANPLASKQPMFAPRAKRVISLFMSGGVSQMDTYDYKSALEKLHGQKLGPTEKPEGFTAMPGTMMKSPFAFQRHGQSGRWVSSVFPEQAKLVDELAFLMAMTGKSNVHGPSTYLMNSGQLLAGFPCLGAWVSYGLGVENENLPGFVVLQSGGATAPHGGVGRHGNADGARHFAIRSAGTHAAADLRSVEHSI